MINCRRGEAIYVNLRPRGGRDLVVCCALYFYLHRMQRQWAILFARISRWWTCQTSQATRTIVTTLLSAVSEIFCKPRAAITDPYFIVAPSPTICSRRESCRLIASSRSNNNYYTTCQHPVLSARPRKMKEKYFANGLMGCCCSASRLESGAAGKNLFLFFWWMTSKKRIFHPLCSYGCGSSWADFYWMVWFQERKEFLAEKKGKANVVLKNKTTVWKLAARKFIFFVLKLTNTRLDNKLMFAINYRCISKHVYPL